MTVTDSKKRLNRFTFINPRDRPARVIEEFHVRVHTQDVIDRGVDVAGLQRMILGRLAQTIGRTDDATALHAASTHQAEHAVAPVVATGRTPT